MNIQQRNYAKAKAFLESLEAEEKQQEAEYIKANCLIGISAIYEIEDDEEFDKHNNALSAITNSSGLWDKILDARKLLKSAEDALIEWGLSYAPAKVRMTLSEQARTNITNRLKIIDWTFRVDAKTMPGA